MNAACPRRVSLITARGLPTIPSPTIGVLSGTVPAATGLPCLHRLRLSLADSPTHADRIEFTCLGSSRPCYGLAVLSPLLSTPHCCDAVTVRYRTALLRTETDSHRSIPSPSQAHERGFHAASTYERRQPTRQTGRRCQAAPSRPCLSNWHNFYFKTSPRQFPPK